MSPKIIEKERIPKDTVAILGQLGGFLKILQSAFRILIEPISSYLFTLVMIKRLYFAKTKEDFVFSEESKHASFFVKHRRSEFLDMNKIPKDLQETTFKEDIKFNRHIILSNADKFLLFIH